MRKPPYVDYSEEGQEKQIADRIFTVQYRVDDYFGNKIYYFEEREKEHIIPERKAKAHYLKR